MISVIIPCKKKEEAFKCYRECRKLARKDIEILVMSDDVTGNVTPGAKRNKGAAIAKGEFLAFIDSDAYPDKYWLNYSTTDVAGWCGPGVLPPNSSPSQVATDWILKLLPFSYRVTPKKLRYVNDYPTFNLIIKTSVFRAVGGFKDDTLTGEDSDLCQRITDLGMKILYIPQCVVYHTRRPLFSPLLRQVATYATHRGYFFRVNRGNSRKVVYLLPSICLLLFILYLGCRLLF